MNAITQAQRTANAIRILRAITPKAAKRRKMPRKLWPTAVEEQYARALRELTVKAAAPAIARVLDLVSGLVQAAKRQQHVDVAQDLDEPRPLATWHVDAGEVKAMMDKAYEEITSRLEVREIAALANHHAQLVSEHNRKQLGRQLAAAFGVKVDIPDTRVPRTIEAFVDQNVSLIIDNVDRLCGNIEKDITRILASTRLDATSRAPVRQSLPALPNVRLIVNRPSDFDAQGLAAAVQRNVAVGGSTRELAQEIEDRFGFAENHAEFVARDQVGKLNGQLDAQRAQSLGVSRFVWRTSGDERVRDEHVARDGETYAYDDPPDGELPGEPINCRCSAEPVIDDLLE